MVRDRRPFFFVEGGFSVMLAGTVSFGILTTAVGAFGGVVKYGKIASDDLGGRAAGLASLRSSSSSGSFSSDFV